MKGEIDRMELLKLITISSFMKEDLSLYLNTHPMDEKVITRYNFHVMESKALKERYEMNYGMLSEHESCSPCPWQWIDQPWPWEYEANFRFHKEGI